MSKKDYNDGLATAARIVEEMLVGTSEGETILCGIESSKQNASKETDITLTVSEAQDIADALSVAMNDIAELLQVAKYNLRGQINSGEIIDKPNPPILIHEQGIAKSEAVIERCRKVWLKVWKKIQDDPAEDK